jgi:hypothetical protein
MAINYYIVFMALTLCRPMTLPPAWVVLGFSRVQVKCNVFSFEMSALVQLQPCNI